MPIIAASVGAPAAAPGFLGSGITDLDTYYASNYAFGLATFDGSTGYINVARDGTLIADPGFSTGKYFYEVDYISDNTYHSIGWASNPADFAVVNPSLVVYMYQAQPSLYDPKLFTIDIGPTTTTMRCFGRQTDGTIAEITSCTGCTFSVPTAAPYHPAAAVYRAATGGAVLEPRYDDSQMTMLGEPELSFLLAEGYQPVSNFYL
jgi:hypothetical protein